MSGFQLPTAFVELCSAIGRGEQPEEWALRADVDAYGRPWSVSDFRVNCDLRTIQAETNLMSKGFLYDNRYQQPSGGFYVDEPGFIAEFTGVSKFLKVGDSTSGETYALDFGLDSMEPSVVYYDAYWRRVAPDFRAFMTLFRPAHEVEPYVPSGEDWEEYDPSPRTMLAAWLPRYVLIDEEQSRPDIEMLREHFEQCGPDDRRDVEAEVRKELESKGMSLEQRRRLDEVWERLRASSAA